MVELMRAEILGKGARRGSLVDEAYAALKQAIRDKLIDHRQYITRHGDDMPEITGWRWGQEAASGGNGSTEADNI